MRQAVAKRVFLMQTLPDDGNGAGRRLQLENNTSRVSSGATSNTKPPTYPERSESPGLSRMRDSVCRCFSQGSAPNAMP